MASSNPVSDTRLRFPAKRFPLLVARAAAAGLPPPDYLEKLLVEEDRRQPLPDSARPSAGMEPGVCLELCRWFRSVGGAGIFPAEVYANSGTRKRSTLDGFIVYLEGSPRERFCKSKMSTNEKVAWRIKHIKQQHELASQAGTVTASSQPTQLLGWAREAQKAYP